MKYKYRDLTLPDDGENWCVYGTDLSQRSQGQVITGVLEWCTGQGDAKSILVEMEKDKDRFKGLRVTKMGEWETSKESPVALALKEIFRTRNKFDYGVTKSAMPHDGVTLFTIGPYPIEKYGVATSKKVAVEYADLLLTDRLEYETDTFDGEWLLRFTPNYSEDTLIELPGEGQKHKYIKEHGVNVKAAIRDMKAAHRNNIDHWLETVFGAFTCTLKTTPDGLVYWRRG